MIYDENGQLWVEPEPSRKKDGIKTVLWLVSAVAVAVILAILIQTFVFAPQRVDGESMLPTLKSGDTVFLLKVGYKVERGDLIVFKRVTERGEKITPVKRVIGLPGDEIRILLDGTVMLNGEELVEDYLSPELTQSYGAPIYYKLSDDEYFVMGDNRIVSLDSREYGPIKKSQIVGKLLR